jgi:1-acyl-sn-glycerol-3-phosphate acyltransferase
VIDPDSATPLDRTVLTSLGPDDLREVIPRFLAGFVGDPAAADRNRTRIGSLVGTWSDATCREVVSLLATIGDEHRVYPAHPACREVSRAWSADVVIEPTLDGVEHLLSARERGPVLVLGNHVSYFDTSATDAVLAWSGHVAIADRLVAAAGPKVYQEVFRLVAAACLNTLPVPQSTRFSHTEKLTPRELARRALESVDAARAALEDGFVLVVYPEGSRSRTGQLGPFLKGVHRWIDCVEGVRVVPLAIAGTDQVMPVGQDKLYPRQVSVRFDAPLEVGRDGDARQILHRTHRAIASLLPPHMQPEAGLDGSNALRE